MWQRAYYGKFDNKHDREYCFEHIENHKRKDCETWDYWKEQQDGGIDCALWYIEKLEKRHHRHFFLDNGVGEEPSDDMWRITTNMKGY